MQFGVGVSDGVGQLLQHANLISKRFPDKALAGLDIRNAFGEVSREWCAVEVPREVPKFSRALEQLWHRCTH